jgi:hypothetical protein
VKGKTTLGTVKTKTGTFQQFKDQTLAVARERTVDPNEPRIWIESREPSSKIPNAYTIAAMASHDLVGPFASSGDLFNALDVDGDAEGAAEETRGFEGHSGSSNDEKTSR